MQNHTIYHFTLSTTDKVIHFQDGSDKVKYSFLPSTHMSMSYIIC